MRVVSRFPIPRLQCSLFFFLLANPYRVLQSSSVLFDPRYWKLTTNGRVIVCVCVETRVLYVARESTRAWYRHLRREGWHPFVCSSRFLNSIALVVWRTLIRWRRVPFFFTVCGRETPMNIFVVLSTIKSAREIPVVDRDNRIWIQSTVDSSLTHLCVIQSSVTIIIEKKGQICGTVIITVVAQLDLQR